MEIEIDRGANVPHKFSMFFNEDVDDNSDIESHISNGTYFRSTMTFYIDDAYLWKTTNRKVKNIDPIELISTTNIKDSSKDYDKAKININKELEENA